MPIYIYRSGGTPPGPGNFLGRLIAAVGTLVMIALVAFVLLPVFGVVVLFAAAAAGVAFAIFAVKRWLYANGGLSEGLRGAAHRAREDFEQSQASPASRTESGESVLRLKKLAREAQAEDAVEIDPKEPR